MSVRERNIKLLPEAVRYMATTETATCIITIEIVMCVMHCRQKLNLIFKVSQTKQQINIPLWTHIGHKEWREHGKTFAGHEMNSVPILFCYISLVISQ